MEGLKRNLKKAAVYGTALFTLGTGGEKPVTAHNNEKAKAQTEFAVLESAPPSPGMKSPVPDYVPPPMTAGNQRDYQKTWLINLLQSKAYHDKAIAEGLTEQDIKQRIDHVRNTPIEILNTEKATSDGADAVTYTDPATGKPVLIQVGSGEYEQGQTFTLHELEHAATGANFGLSNKARQIYGPSTFVRTRTTDEHVIKYEDYLEKLTERDARKRQLEFEAERMGIWKYGQPYTEATQKKVMMLYKTGRFTYGVNQPIQSTTPEGLMEMMNKIAQTPENQQPSANPENLPLETNQG